MEPLPSDSTILSEVAERGWERMVEVLDGGCSNNSGRAVRVGKFLPEDGGPCCQRMGVSVSSCVEVSAVGVARTLRRHVEQNFESARLGIFGGRGFLRSCSGSPKSKKMLIV